MTTILVAEDDPDIRDFVVVVLEAAGHDVDVAEDGAEALEALARGPYDLIVADHHMPRVTGAEIVVYVAEHVPDTKSLLMSGDHEMRFIDAVASGRAGFLAKPFDRRSLAAAVEGLLRTEALSDSA